MDPIAPEELSTCSMAGEIFSKKRTAPEAANSGSFFATRLISDRASLMRCSGLSDCQPKACYLKRAANCHL